MAVNLNLSWNWLAPFAKALASAAAAAAVAYVFLFLLMGASVQQHVVARLDRENQKAGAAADQLDYSTAWARVQAAGKARDRRAAIDRELGAARQEYDEAEAKLSRSFARVDDGWDRFAPLAVRAARGAKTPECGAGADLAALKDPELRRQTWGRILGCLDTYADAPADMLKREALSTDSFGSAFNAHRDVVRNLNIAESRVKSASARRDAATAEITAAERLEPLFDEFAALNDHAILRHGSIAAVPPTVLQILLAFSSGTFGALLVTLILVVYPNNNLQITATTENVTRIFLGGLISVGVFIVLGGGAAILGSGGGLNADNANFMTFAAVGVLAGMFSDRVALWLSDRATSFFASQAAGGGAGAAPGAALTSVVPATAVRGAGPTPITLSGAGLAGMTEVELALGATVVKGAAVRAATGQVTATVFIGGGMPAGAWTVVVRNATGQSAQLPGAFQVT